MYWFVICAMKAFMPAGDTLKGVADTGLNEFLSQVRREAPVLIRIGLLASTAVVIWTPLFTVGWPLPLFALPTHLRERHAHRLSTHRFYLLRQCALMVKMFAGLCWARDDEVRRHFGLDPLPADPGSFRGQL